MKTKVFLKIFDGPKVRLVTFPTYGEAKAACPKCKASPLQVQGTGRRIAKDDRAYEADAISKCCDSHVGTIRAEVDTLFGLREDEAVMRFGAKIY